MTTVLLAGLCTVDVVQRVGDFPAPGEKLRSTSVELAAGGPAANAAVTVAALGARAVLITGLGQHPLASVARGDLARWQVEVCDLAAQRAAPPTVSAVTVREVDGERTVVSHNASDVDLAPPADLDVRVRQSDAVLLDGHHPRLASATAVAARRLGVPSVLDAGSFKPVLDEVLPLVDVCACSETFRLPARSDAQDTEQALHDLGIPLVVRTHGAQPVTWSCRTPDGLVRGSVDAVDVVARETVGAGDVWHGALAYGIARLRRSPQPSEIPDVVRRANEVAAARVSAVGPRTWIAAT